MAMEHLTEGTKIDGLKQEISRQEVVQTMNGQARATDNNDFQMIPSDIKTYNPVYKYLNS